MSGSIRLSLTADQACAINNALRREIEIQQRLLSDRNLVGVNEYLRHLDGALKSVSRGWECTFGLPEIQQRARS